MPEGLGGMTAGHMEGHSIEVLADPAPDLDEPEAQRPELDVRDLALFEPAPDRVEQPVGSRVEEQPELIGPEGMTAQPIGEAVVLEVLDAQLWAIAPPGVPGVQRLGWIVPTGDR